MAKIRCVNAKTGKVSFWSEEITNSNPFKVSDWIAQPLPTPTPIIKHEVKAEPATFANDVEEPKLIIEPIIKKKATRKKKSTKSK